MGAGASVAPNAELADGLERERGTKRFGAGAASAAREITCSTTLEDEEAAECGMKPAIQKSLKCG